MQRSRSTAAVVALLFIAAAAFVWLVPDARDEASAAVSVEQGRAGAKGGEGLREPLAEPTTVRDERRAPNVAEIVATGDDEPIAIEVRFVTLDGAPVGAAIPFQLFECADGCLDDIAGPGAPRSSVAVDALSNEAGVASFRAPPDAVYQVVVTDHHYVAGSATLDTRRSSSFDVRLGEGAVLTGVVLATDGRPIEGARVGVSLNSFVGGLADAPSVFSRANYRFATTDARGVYTLSVIPGSTVRVSAMGEGYATGVSEEVTLERAYAEAAPIVLQPEALASVDVLDPEGVLAPGDEVRLAPAREFLFQVERRRPVRASGTMLFRGLPEDDYRLTLASRDGEASEVELRLGVGEQVHRALTVRSRSPLTGLVRDADGAPVARARVSLRDGGRRSEGRSNPDGAFRVGSYTSGTRELVVHAEGFVEYRTTLDGNPSRAGAPWVVELERGLGVRLRATFAGEPVEAFRVECQHTPPGARVPALAVRRARTEAGELSLFGFTEGRVAGKVRSAAEGGLIGVFEVDLFAGEAVADLEVDLVRSVDVSGVVVDTEGTPLAGARIRVAAEDADDEAAVLLAVTEAMGGGAGLESSALGEFLIEDVHPRDTKLVVTLPGYERVELRLEDVGPGFLIVRMQAR